MVFDTDEHNSVVTEIMNVKRGSLSAETLGLKLEEAKEIIAKIQKYESISTKTIFTCHTILFALQ